MSLVWQGLIKFNKGLMRMPLNWQLWVLLLVIANFLIPLFYLCRIEAQVVLGVFLTGALLIGIITGLTGFTRLLGLGHFLWFPLFFFLWTRLDQLPNTESLGLWIRALMIINAASLVLDVLDVVCYLAGEREEVVQCLD